MNNKQKSWKDIYINKIDDVYSFSMVFGYLQMFVGGLMSYLRYLCLFAHSGVKHILSCVFICLVYPMLPVSLDCPFLIADSVFVSFSGLSIFDC